VEDGTMSRIGTPLMVACLATSTVPVTSHLAADHPDRADDPAAVAALESMKAGIVYDDAGRVRSLAPPADRGAEALKHVRSLRGLVSLDLRGSAISDDDLQHLSVAVPQLRVLNLSRTAIGDAGLAHFVRFAEMDQLQVLDLSGTALTDAGLSHLARLPRLEELDLDRTSITDAGVAQLAALDKLTELSLTGSDITDAGFYDLGVRTTNDAVRRAAFKEVEIRLEERKVEGQRLRSLVGYHQMSDANLAHLVQLPDVAWAAFPFSRLTDNGVHELEKWPKLREVNIESESLSDESLKMLSHLPQVAFIGLDCPNVTDLGLFYLRNHQTLKVLVLRSHRITDRGLEHLETLKSLQLLHVCSRNTTEAGRIKLRRALPGVAIDVSDKRWPDFFLKEPRGYLHAE
jgi:Leucine-rich repeat (LRR) protein